ncbi:PREDICTED: chymotrypsin-1-like [Ceratosolen solmsi marchali]|uniref:Chymotrypsin-1-like n=1 Tax=Ceratosolen solmsi marchali TaxID=326594 RepID=A0AAJ6YUR7_9HYME|nr:PREDICTED: chymotrypsin-1-like [Ceratosolen solmsi marchali]
MRYIIAFCTFSLLTIGVLAKHVRIMGGEDVDVRAYPFMASFRYLGYASTFCTGVIISNKHIVTTAQALAFRSMDISLARVYTATISTDINIGIAHKIQQIFIHPRYTGEHNQDEMFLHDIAIVKLKEAIQLNEVQNTIEILQRDITENDRGFVLGWGSTSFPTLSYPTKMQKVNMNIVPERLYNNYFNFVLHDTQFGGLNKKGIGLCIGDIGDPLIIDGKLAGLASFSRPCALGVPDVYVKIYYYIDFIRDMINR